MADSDKTDYWSENFTSDPVAAEAQRFAVAATNPKPSKARVIVDRLLIGLFVILLVLSTTATIVSSINTAKINHTNGCLQILVERLAVEQKARNEIGAKDRQATADIFKNVFRNAHTKEEFQAAYDKYLAQLAANDKDRLLHPLPTYKDVCGGK